MKFEEQNLNKEKHLKEGISPIFACVGTTEDYEKGAEIEEIEKTGENIDYDVENAGKAYVISAVDKESKYTKFLQPCTGLAVVGEESASGEQLSILTHQNMPKVFEKDLENLFVEELKNRLLELKEKCSEKTIDIAIFGGYLVQGDAMKYEKSLEVLNNVVQDVFHFEPTVVCGPKDGYFDNVYLDTQKRRLYVARPRNAVLRNESFKPSQIGEMKRKWDKEMSLD